MKKSKIFIFLLVLIVSLSLLACQEEISSNEISSRENPNIIEYSPIEDIDGLNHYDIKVDLKLEDMTYKGEQYVTYLNKSQDDLDYIYFHLYPNAFKTLKGAPILFDVRENMDEKSYVNGYIDIIKTQIDGNILDFKLEKNSEILKVILPKALKSGEKTEIYIEYNVKIPSTEDRFGYHDNGINFGNCYPIASVYDQEGWHLDPYYSVGDPFFSEVSNYDVEIKVPENIEIAASGKTVNESVESNKRIYSFKGDKIRDFAFAASEKFVIATRKLGDTLIKLYSITDNQEVMDLALDFAEDSISIFSEKFGKYPYDEYKIVNTEFPSGMEYPGIVFVSNDYFNESLIDILELVIVHETAHQWWYGIVGTDQINDSWIDEGLATYSEVIYMDQVYGKEAADFHYNQNIKNIYENNSQYLGADRKVDKALKDFENWNDYSMLVYSKSVGFFKAINDKYGSETLEKILGETYKNYKFKNISQDEFILLCEEITGDSMDSLIEKHLR